MSDIAKLLLRSGPCWDSPAWLRVYLAGLKNPVSRLLLLALRIKFSPAVLENIRASALPELEKAALFSGAMNLFRAGTAFKTTAAARSPLTDTALLAKARPGALIVETGVSDGISALGLLGQAAGAEVLLSDLQAGFPYVGGPLCTRYYGTDGAYLSLKFPLFLLCTGRRSAPPAGAPEVSLLNPLISGQFPAVKLAAFDIFSGALPRKADIIKCANVLNLQYFSSAEIRRAVENLAVNLNEGGWLFISQNNPKYKEGEAYLALRKEGGRLALSEEKNGHELLSFFK
ncbi:MAG: hypothetical protein PHV33_09515 [Elusimicrobiales bacterium]|nr:hypothetical protein [Elusimicrobiales bacterium]